jgi:hypothetical protein
MIPIVLFAYARPNHLRRTLECLRLNRVPVIYAFSDGACTPDKASVVAEVRQILRAIDWCKVVICEREANLGLGRSILAGVTEVLKIHDAAIIFEDDLVCVPGTYAYLCAALEYYKNDLRVMSVTGWTHPIVTPGNITDRPYFDGRAESWVWGTWSRAWKGMRTDAKSLMERCGERGIDVYGYGTDLAEMAKMELERNIWAVRFLYWHILNRTLCLRPPWSMVKHIGFDAEGTNAKDAGIWDAAPLKPCPPKPEQWPGPIEHPECSRLWRRCCGRRPTLFKSLYNLCRSMASKVADRWINAKEDRGV